MKMSAISHHHSHHHHHQSLHHSIDSDDSDYLKCKKRVNLGAKMSYSSSSTPPPTSVARRNERERNRVKMVNMGFATLRQHVPNGAKNKKMSKVETLRSAVEYIRQLQKLLGQNMENSFDLEQYANSFQIASDENSYPASVNSPQMSSMAPSPVESNYESHHVHHHHSMLYGNDGISSYSATIPGSVYSTSPSTSDEVMSSVNSTNPTTGSSYGSILNTTTPCDGTSPTGIQLSRNHSPSPSVASDISSSPYDHHQQQSHHIINHHHHLSENGVQQAESTSVVTSEDELFDFTNWF